MFAPGPFTARFGKRPVIEVQPELERYLKGEFAGGAAVKGLLPTKEDGAAVAPRTEPKPAERPAGRPARTAALDLDRTKPVRVLSKA